MRRFIYDLYYADEVEEVRYKAIKEFEYLNSYILNDTEKQNIISDIVEYIFRERQNQPHCECAAYGGTD